MTEEQLKRGKEVHSKITELERFKRAFAVPHVNVIRANAFDGEKDTTESLMLCNYPNLEKLIKNEVDKMIQELREKFSEI